MFISPVWYCARAKSLCNSTPGLKADQHGSSRERTECPVRSCVRTNSAGPIQRNAHGNLRAAISTDECTTSNTGTNPNPLLHKIVRFNDCDGGQLRLRSELALAPRSMLSLRRQCREGGVVAMLGKGLRSKAMLLHMTLSHSLLSLF